LALSNGPPEPFLKTRFNHPVLAGHAHFGRHLMDTALDRDFDPSFSHRLTLDHGFCLPLWRMCIDPIPQIVPIVVNEMDDPMLTMRRCLAWGSIIKLAIETYPEDLRVAVLTLHKGLDAPEHRERLSSYSTGRRNGRNYGLGHTIAYTVAPARNKSPAATT